jgi:hypothetical protein
MMISKDFNIAMEIELAVCRLLTKAVTLQEFNNNPET